MGLAEEIINAMDFRIKMAKPPPEIHLGTVSAVSPLTVLFDGSDVAVPCLKGATTTLKEGWRVWAHKLASDNEFVVVDSFDTDPTGAPKPSYYEKVLDTSQMVYSIQHDLNHQFVDVTVYENAAPFAKVDARVECFDANSCNVSFEVAPDASAYRVVVRP